MAEASPQVLPACQGSSELYTYVQDAVTKCKITLQMLGIMYQALQIKAAVKQRSSSPSLERVIRSGLRTIMNFLHIH